MVIVEEPVAVVGDIHGQYNDLVRMMEKAGPPVHGELSYLFLGDYVDRGVEGIEVTLLLFMHKIKSSNAITMLRGNHESRSMTESFTFRDEVLAKYDMEIYEMFMDTFDMLPLAAWVGGRYLCVHGGIGPELKKIDDINKVERFREVPLDGLLCDLLWSDPMDEKEGVSGNWRDNPQRECAYYFGRKPVKQLFKQNPGMLSIFRAHQVKENGYEMHKFGK